MIVHGRCTDHPTGLSSDCIKFRNQNFFEKNSNFLNFFSMKVLDLLVLGPVVNAAGELKIQLPGRNGERFFMSMKNSRTLYQNWYLVSTVLFVPRSGLSQRTVLSVLRRSLISPSKDNRSRPSVPYSVLLERVSFYFNH